MSSSAGSQAPTSASPSTTRSSTHDERAYTLTVLRPDGSRIVENVILTHEDGLIAIVEAWD